MLAALAFVSPARADDIETARGLFRQGNELHEKNDIKGALEKYEAAHALVATPITGLMVARTHLELGHLVAARDALVAVRKMPLKPKESDNTKAARVEADKLADEVESRIPRIRVVVEGATGATILIDGVAASSDARQVDPGNHVVLVRAGAIEKTNEITIAEKETREVRIVFATPLAAPAAAPAPMSPSSPAIVEPEAKRGRPTWIYVGFGVAGAGVVVGSIAGIVTLRGASDLETSCRDGRCPPGEHGRLSSTRTWSTVSTVSFVVAGAAAAIAVVGLATSHSRVTPTVGLGTVGLAGSF